MSRPPSYSSPMDNTRFNVRSILAGDLSVLEAAPPLEEWFA